MGRKRKRGDGDERILRKIRKLEEKVYKRRHNYNSSTDSESNSDNNYEDINTDHTYYSPNGTYYEPLTQHEAEILSPYDPSVLCESMDEEPMSPRAVPRDTQPSANSAQPSTSAAQPSTSAARASTSAVLPSTSAAQPSTSTVQPSTSAVQPSTSTAQPSTSAAQSSILIEALDDDILSLLGDAPKEEPSGPDVHTDIASRLQEVLQNGLKKDLKEKILLDYPIPGNCQLFKAPLLNAEVKAAVSDPLLKKDSSLAARQGQIGHALAALANTINILVAEKSDFNQQLIKHISNACRLLCDSHYIDTQLRRNFLISTLNNKLKDTLKESKRDKNLFGEDLSEKLKVSKVINKSSQDLKYNRPRSYVNRNPNTPSASTNLNWKRPQSSYQTQNRRPVPASANHRSAGAPSTPYYYRPRAETDGRRRPPPPPPRARANAHYKKRR